MYYIYFLTIDKVKLDGPPTKLELLGVCKAICRVGDLQPLLTYEVYCFEIKYKGKAHGEYLHYHCLLKSLKPFISYLLIYQKGYAVKLVKLKSHLDVAVTAGYIQKLKIDECDVEKFRDYSINCSNPDL